jgi:predicted PurR-regulated permease PerM
MDEQVRVDSVRTKADPYDIAAWVAVAVGLVMAIKLRLLLAFLSGMLVFELVQLLVPLVHRGSLRGHRAKIAAVVVLAAVIVALLAFVIFGTLAFLQSTDNLPMLLQEMAAVLEASRHLLPTWMTGSLPGTVEELQVEAVDWLRIHAADVQLAGLEVARGTAHALIGMVIGAMISLREAVSERTYGPLAQALARRVDRFGASFHRIIFAQVRIAGINTFFTWLYLGVALPLLGVDLPFIKTMIAVTFIAGLLPVLGNLISNTVIVIVSLSWSLGLAGASLTYLVVIHKLEYFLNAHIIGTRISASAWELLIAMLVMEAAFGFRGLIAAPIYYAYLKEELSAEGMI